MRKPVRFIMEALYPPPSKLLYAETECFRILLAQNPLRLRLGKIPLLFHYHEWHRTETEAIFDSPRTKIPYERPTQILRMTHTIAGSP